MHEMIDYGTSGDELTMLTVSSGSVRIFITQRQNLHSRTLITKRDLFEKGESTQADKKSGALHAKAEWNLIFCRMNSGAVIRNDTCVLSPLNHRVHVRGEKNRFRVR